jgi:hypothetical protein
VQISRGKQDENEVRAFQDFVAQARLPVVPESVQKRDPPEPDILCRLKNGEQLAFELVEICHPKNAAFLGGAFSPAAEPNADGSTTIYFAPNQPTGVKRGNWIQTDPQKGWFTILRLYNPLPAFFDKSWRAGEIEPSL